MRPPFFRRTVFLILAIGAFLRSAAPDAQAKSGDTGDTAGIGVDFFGDALKEDGAWYDTAEYGAVWQPYIAYKSDDWRPYTDGHWCHTDGGWLFVSNESFGWAAYHYGRWTRLKDIGWAWVPGADWAPAWVAWRASKPDEPEGTDPLSPTEDYVGWAPLPPESQAHTTVDATYGPAVDVDFGIDPGDYCFTDAHSFGAPYLAAVIFDPGRSYHCCEHSVNITHLYYNRTGRYLGFYAGGPRYEPFRDVTQRPIPQYDLRPITGAAAQTAIRKGQFNRIGDQTIGVISPQFSRANVASDGKIKFTRAGASTKAEVNRGAPAAAADDPAYQQARESFTKQGDAYRAQHPAPTPPPAPAEARPDSPASESAPKPVKKKRKRKKVNRLPEN